MVPISLTPYKLIRRLRSSLTEPFTSSYGHVWEIKLRELWADRTLSIKDIVEQLKSTKMTVRRHAARLKLYSQDWGRKLKPPNHKTLLKTDAVVTAREQKRSACRSRWLSAKKRKPNITLRELRGDFPREYAWLQQNDADWFRKHCPKPRPRSPSASRVNWGKRDLDMSAAVKASAQRLKNTPGRPVRVTTTSIGRDIGAVSLLQQQLHQMPHTVSVLKSVTESDADFSARRIQWATDQYVKEGVMPRRWQFVARAYVYHLINVKGVQEAIDVAILTIHTRLEQEFYGAHTERVVGI